MKREFKQAHITVVYIDVARSTIRSLPRTQSFSLWNFFQGPIRNRKNRLRGCLSSNTHFPAVDLRFASFWYSHYCHGLLVAAVRLVNSIVSTLRKSRAYFRCHTQASCKKMLSYDRHTYALYVEARELPWKAPDRGAVINRRWSKYGAWLHIRYMCRVVD